MYQPKLITLFIAAGLLIAGSCGESEEQETTDEQNTSTTQEGGEPAFDDFQASGTDIDVSQQDLETFAEINTQLRQHQRGVQQEMITAIEDEGMEVQRYQEIMQSQQQPGGEGGENMTDEEQEQFDAITVALEEMDAAFQEKIEEVVEDADMEMERFEEIAQALQQDQELQQQFQQIMQQQQQGQMQQSQQPPQ